MCIQRESLADELWITQSRKALDSTNAWAIVCYICTTYLYIAHTKAIFFSTNVHVCEPVIGLKWIRRKIICFLCTNCRRMKNLIVKTKNEKKKTKYMYMPIADYGNWVADKATESYQIQSICSIYSHIWCYIIIY